MRIVIVGAGTDVGKTHVGVALVSAFASRGASVCGLKPIESGVPSGEVGPDATALEQASQRRLIHPQPYVFADPVSPHLAARRAGIAVELGTVRTWVDRHSADWVLIETAGGLLSPLALNLTNLDLAKSLNPDALVLVALDRLGVLHDVAACQLALRVGFAPAPPPPTVVVLQTPAVLDASTGTNAPELQLLGTAAEVIVMPRGAPTSPECQLAAKAILSCFT